MSGRRTAIVIGSGFGGLSVAIRLQAAGVQTTLLERRDAPGGRAYVYRDQGFTFDAGPTVITDPSALEELFAAGGRKLSDYVELLPVTPFYRLVWPDGTQFDYVNDQAELDRQIAALSPQDVEGYRRFLAYSRAVFAEGYLKLGAVPFLHIRDMMRAGPQLAKLEAWRSVYAKVATYLKDERLRQAFSFHSLLVGGNPFATSSIYALIHALEREWGVWFPKGGTGALVDGMVRLFQDLGGKLILSADVKDIAVRDGKASGVRLADGRALDADIVVSNADVVHTYGTLLSGTARGRAAAAKLERRRHSMSLFVIYFGLDRLHDQLAHHTVLFGPRYRDLIQEIFKGPELAQDFSLYLHSPCITDPSLAPAGMGSYYVLSPVPHLGNGQIDWSTAGPLYRDRILDYLEANHMPGLRSQMKTCRIFTPDDFKSELNAHVGSAFSLEPILTQSAWFRVHNRDDEIANLYFVGAGTHPGAGVPGVVASAKATAGLILAAA